MQREPCRITFDLEYLVKPLQAMDWDDTNVWGEFYEIPKTNIRCYHFRKGWDTTKRSPGDVSIHVCVRFEEFKRPKNTGQFETYQQAKCHISGNHLGNTTIDLEEGVALDAEVEAWIMKQRELIVARDAKRAEVKEWNVEITANGYESATPFRQVFVVRGSLGEVEAIASDFCNSRDSLFGEAYSNPQVEITEYKPTKPKIITPDQLKTELGGIDE